MACARLPGSTLLKKVLDVCWSAMMRSIAYGIAVDVLPWANVSHLRLSAMIYRSKFPFEVKGSAFLWTRLSPTRRCAWDLKQNNSNLKLSDLPKPKNFHVTHPFSNPCVPSGLASTNVPEIPGNCRRIVVLPAGILMSFPFVVLPGNNGRVFVNFSPVSARVLANCSFYSE